MDQLLGQALATRRGLVNLGRRVLSIFLARRQGKKPPRLLLSVLKPDVIFSVPMSSPCHQ
jgi:hypothetical protein